MKNVIHGLWLSAAISFAFTVGCGEVTNNGTTCSSDSDCGATDMCHTGLKKCVPSCTGAVDCPSSAKTCATLAGNPYDVDAGVKAFCNCSTDALCNGGSTGSLVCQTETSMTCESKCGSGFSCPSGSTCDSATGVCKKGGGTDGGTDGGTQTSCAGADWDICNGPTEICDFTTGFCTTPISCNASNPQPDTCAFPNWCNAGTCNQVHKPICAAFTPPGGKTPTFDPLTLASPAPIIYAYDENAADDTAFCATTGLNAFTVTLYAYRDDADWPAQLSAVPGFFYVKTDGSETSATANIRPMSGYSHTGKMASFKATFCSSTITSNLQLGFYFTNGNEFCALATQGTVVP